MLYEVIIAVERCRVIIEADHPEHAKRRAETIYAAERDTLNTTITVAEVPYILDPKRAK